MLRFLYKHILWILSIIMGGLLALNILLALNAPWWAGLIVIGILFMAGLGIILVVQAWVRWRSRRFIGRIMEQQRGHHGALDEQDRNNQAERNERFLAAMEIYYKTDSSQSTPLLTRPWYLILGSNGAGKTTALSRVQFPATTLTGFAGTRHCDWRISRHTVTLDTAGLHTIPIDEGKDKQEWRTFMNLLATYRRPDPLNAVIISVAVNRLLQTRPEVLEEEGRQLSLRLEALERMLGHSFPVYVLVTKCDLIPGMNSFCSELEELQMQQALGEAYHGAGDDITTFITQAMARLKDRFQRLLLLVLNNNDQTNLDPAMLFLPAEFARLKPGIQAYIHGIFATGGIHATKLFRGLYFASARQHGSSQAQFIKALGLGEEPDATPVTEHSLFLDDFFNHILPSSQTANHLSRSVTFGSAIRGWWMQTWAALFLVFGILLSGMCLTNLVILSKLPGTIAYPRHMGPDFSSDLSAMDRYADDIISLNERARPWWVSGFGLPGNPQVMEWLQQDYCRRFDSKILPLYDRTLALNIQSYGPADPRRGPCLAYLAGRIKVLTVGAKAKSVASISNKAVSDTVRFERLYALWLSWETDQKALAGERVRMRALLRQTVMQAGDFHWVTDWINADPGSTPLTLSTFWGRTMIDQVGDPRIDPCYTLSGFNRITAFLENIQAGLAEPGDFPARQAAFLAWYHGAYGEAWHAFGLAFSKGRDRLKGCDGWQAMAGRIAQSDGPYFGLLHRMQTELQPILQQGQPIPEWLRPVFEFGRYQALSRSAAAGPAAPGVHALIEYETALAKLSKAANTSRSEAFQVAYAAFSEDSRSSALIQAEDAYRRLHAASSVPKEPFWSLVYGPLDFLWTYTSGEAAHHLQMIWENKVVHGIQPRTDPVRMHTLLFAPDGMITTFVKGPAAPFMERDIKGHYSAREYMGHTIPFAPAFLGFLSQAQPKQEMPPVQDIPFEQDVIIEGQPTEANDGARLQPHATRLDVHCGNEINSLMNLNYPVSRNFSWKQSCSGMVLNIAVGTITLSKSYDGPKAMAAFMTDFRNGSHTFTPRDFPLQSQALKEMGITALTVQYRITTHRPAVPVANRAKVPAIRIPSTIVHG